MKKTKNAKFSKKKKIIIVLSCILGTFLVLFISSYFIIGNFFFKYSLDATFATVHNAPNEMVVEMPIPKTEDEWFENIPKSEEEIASGGYALKAYKILASNNEHKWVIIIHGYRSKARDMSHYARKFYEEGFNVLMPDLKGHGQSEGKYVGMGYSDSLDILKWINVIIEEDSEAKIVLHGVSMGGATVMFTTGLKLPENVVCAIEDCGYSNVYNQFRYIAKEIMGLPIVDFLMGASDVFVRARMGASLKQMNVVDALKKSTTPTLFIHGDTDDFVPFKMLDEVYNANLGLEKEKLVIEGATHAYSATLEESLYFNSVFEFVEKYTK